MAAAQAGDGHLDRSALTAQDGDTPFHLHLSGLVKEYELVYAELQRLRSAETHGEEPDPLQPHAVAGGAHSALRSGRLQNTQPVQPVSVPEVEACEGLHVHFNGLREASAKEEDNGEGGHAAEVRAERSLQGSFDLKLRSTWASKDSPSSHGHSRKSKFSVRLHGNHGSGCEDYSNVLAHHGVLRHFLSFPGSPCRLLWDMMGALFLLCDIILIPLRAFDPPDSDASRILDWLILVYWTLDVVASFLVGYVHGGITIMQPRRIAAHYARTWLVVDLAILVPDWTLSLLFIGPNETEQASSTEVLRLLRGLRMMRLVRVFKLKSIAEKLDDIINSEYLNIVTYIIRMILLLLVINHIIACIWFYIATVEGQRGRQNWVSFHKFEYDEWYYKYATAFHWSITQFTPASMHVQPQNFWERFYCLLVVVLALVIFSYIVGSITSALAQIRTMHEDKNKQFAKVRRYLAQNSVPISLSIRIKRYLEHAWSSQLESVSAGSIRVLGLLSEQLHNELRSSIISPHLSVHPLLRNLSHENPRMMQRIIDSAIEEKSYATDDSVFLEGEAAPHAYFPITGRFRYIYTSDGLPCRTSHHEKKQEVEPGTHWISEPSIWLENWHHVGMFVAASESQLILIDGRKFADEIRTGPAGALANICGFAKEFVDAMRNGTEDLAFGGELSCVENDHHLLSSWFPHVGHHSSIPATKTLSLTRRFARAAKK